MNNSRSGNHFQHIGATSAQFLNLGNVPQRHATGQNSRAVGSYNIINDSYISPNILLHYYIISYVYLLYKPHIK